MAIKDQVKTVLKVDRKTFFNPRAWFGYNEVKGQTVFLYDTIKQILSPQAPEREESYDEALVRLGITDAESQETGKTYLYFSWMYAALGIGAFLIGFYLLFAHETFAGFMLALAVAALLGVQAFRYNFWHFQIKFRKLGCTFEEWKQGKPNDGLGGPTA